MKKISRENAVAPGVGSFKACHWSFKVFTCWKPRRLAWDISNLYETIQQTRIRWEWWEWNNSIYWFLIKQTTQKGDRPEWQSKQSNQQHLSILKEQISWARSEQKQYSKSKEPYLVDHVVAGAQIVVFGQFNGLAFGKDRRKKTNYCWWVLKQKVFT